MQCNNVKDTIYHMYEKNEVDIFLEMAAPVRSVGRLVPSSTALLLCDMQV